jgi:uncharacterized membrane protein
MRQHQLWRDRVGALKQGGTVMADVKSNIDVYALQGQPAIRKISPGDLTDALAKGWDDFKAMPTFAVFLVVIYPLIGVVLFSLTFGYDMLPLAFPLIAGFALIGPFAAVGLYELSRRREQGLEGSSGGFAFLGSPAIGSIVLLGVVLLAIFVVWLMTAQSIYESIFGNLRPDSLTALADLVLGTSAGWTLIVVGCGVGFLFAVATFAISAVSFPMLLDRNPGVPVAVLTSIRAVLINPVTMALWGLIVAGLLVLGILAGFIGLIVVLPVLGHSTWHLYRAVVEH